MACRGQAATFIIATSVCPYVRMLRRAFGHPPAVYVQLESSAHPANARGLLLQRVEGDAVWTVAHLSMTSAAIKRRTFVFLDTTSAETWGERR